MLDGRSHKLDVVALGLLALALFLGVALVTYNAADPPSTLVFPPHTKIANACGRSGALVAELLLKAFGLGAYFLVLSLAVFDAILLARRKVTEPVLRAIGWGMALLGVTTFLALAYQGATPGPVIGPGGYLGATGRALLEMHFARAGAYILTISFILAGLLLSTDYMLVRASLVSLGLVAAVGRHAGRQMIGAKKEIEPKKKTKPRADDIEEFNVDETAEDAEEAAPAVRIRGKRRQEGADESEAEVKHESEARDAESDDTESADSNSSDEDEDEADDAETPAGRPSVGARLASALRIRNLAKPDERVAVMKELDEASRKDEPRQYELPSIDLLEASENVSTEAHEQEVRQKAKILEKTFGSFGFKVKVVEIETGPVIAQYEVELEAGLRLSKITGLADDLAIALRVPSVRIVAPIPGKNTVGIEVPNNERQLVRLREVIEEADGKTRKMQIPVCLGKDVSGNPLVVDLATLPHLLIAGRTGTGKSVCLNSIIVSILMSRGPDDVRMLMIDPKMVELSPYMRLPHLMHPVVTDMRKAEAILAWAVEKMEERYALLARAGVRHIKNYNNLGEEELMERLQPETDDDRAQIPLHLPYIVIVADEMADLMMTSAKEVEQHIIRLAQKSRAVGIHLVLATQKPTVDVITGLIKSNLPARIAFQVASRTDSRVVLDEMGAEKLLGNGDMLFLWPGTSTMLRGQGAYLSDEEINKVVGAVATTEPQFVKELVQLKAADPAEGGASRLKSRDEFYEAAVETVIREGRGSVSLLQRALGIGYGRAARLIDYMAEDGIVGTYNGSQAREVLITLDQWAEMLGQDTVPEPPRAKRNRIMPEGAADAAPKRLKLDREGAPFEDDEDEAAADVADNADYDEDEDEADDDADDEEQADEDDESDIDEEEEDDSDADDDDEADDDEDEDADDADEDVEDADEDVEDDELDDSAEDQSDEQEFDDEDDADNQQEDDADEPSQDDEAAELDEPDSAQESRSPARLADESLPRIHSIRRQRGGLVRRSE